MTGSPRRRGVALGPIAPLVEVDEVEAHRGLIVVAVVDRSPADRLLADSLFFVSDHLLIDDLCNLATLRFHPVVAEEVVEVVDRRLSGTAVHSRS